MNVCNRLTRSTILLKLLGFAYIILFSLSELDDNKTVLLVSLDVSAAFDTLDYCILSGLLENRLGISPTQCLNWFRSYLSDRAQEELLLIENVQN